jgi:hypothetical protein
VPNAASPLTYFPAYLTAGTTFKVDRSFSGYSNTGWAYSLLLRGDYRLDVAGTADANASLFHVVVAPTDTAKLNPAGGKSLAYSYVERLTATDGSGETLDVAAGRIMVEPNLASLQDGDAITDEEKTLRAIKAEIFSRVTGQQSIDNYSIGGRSVSKIRMAELVELRGVFERIVWKQRNPGRFSTPIDIVFPSNQVGPLAWWRSRPGSL